MPDMMAGAVERAAWAALLSRGDVKLAAFVDRGPAADLEVLFASRSFLRLADRSPHEDVAGQPATRVLDRSPDCLGTLRAFRPSLAGNSAIEWDCRWPADGAGPGRRCVLIPFDAGGLRGGLLAVEDAGRPAGAEGRSALPGLPVPTRLEAGGPADPFRATGWTAMAADAGDGAAGAASGTLAMARPRPDRRRGPTAADACAGRGRGDPAYGLASGAEPDCAAGPLRPDDRVGSAGGAPAPTPAPTPADADADEPTGPAMEPEFWQAFVQIADQIGIPIDELYRTAAGDRGYRDPDSAIRTFVLRYFQVQGHHHAT